MTTNMATLLQRSELGRALNGLCATHIVWAFSIWGQPARRCHCKEYVFTRASITFVAPSLSAHSFSTFRGSVDITGET